MFYIRWGPPFLNLMSAFFSNLTYANFEILASKIKNNKHMSPKFRGENGKTHITCLYHFSLRQCFAFVAKLYLSSHFLRLEAITSISVPRLSSNYLKKRFQDFSCFWGKLEDKHQLTFPEIISVLLKCLPRPRLGVLHVPLVISGLENTRDLIEINLKKDNCYYGLHADGNVSLDLDFKT